MLALYMYVCKSANCVCDTDIDATNGLGGDSVKNLAGQSTFSPNMCWNRTRTLIMLTLFKANVSTCNGTGQSSCLIRVSG